MLKYLFSLSVTLLLLTGCTSYPTNDYKSVKFTVFGNVAKMTGVIDHTAIVELKSTIEKYPTITTIEMIEVEGSVDDEANLELSRYVRSLKLNTHIPKNGLIASGGTDFFIAGTIRTAHPSAQIGVHGWAEEDENGNFKPARKFKADDVIHQDYLRYFREMNIPEDFYWFTLRAAPYESIHWMTPSELKKYQILTP